MKPLAPLRAEFKNFTDNPDINPNYIKPKNFMLRLQKIMDEYSGGVTANFTTSKTYLDRGLELLTFLKEDAEKLAAADLHELMRVLGERAEDVAGGGPDAGRSSSARRRGGPGTISGRISPSWTRRTGGSS